MKRDEILAALKAGATDPPRAWITGDWEHRYLCGVATAKRITSPQWDALRPQLKAVRIPRRDGRMKQVWVHQDCPLPDCVQQDNERRAQREQAQKEADLAAFAAFTGPSVALEIAQKAYHNDSYNHVTELARDVEAILAAHGLTSKV